MRNIHFALLFILFAGPVSSQTYYPIPEDSSDIWVMGYHGSQDDGCDEMHVFNYRMIGDTLLSGNHYKKVMVENMLLFYHNMGWPNCSNAPANGYVGGFRQDSINKKCYMMLPGMSTDTLIYDFNLQIGDTLKSIAIPTFFCTNYVSTLTSIDSVLVNGTYHLRQTFCTYNVIEGVGSENDPFGILPNIELAGIICFRNDTMGFYEPDPPSCTYFTGLIANVPQSTSIASIQVFPNPCRGILKIIAEDKIRAIRIYDAFSHLYINLTCTENEQEINLQSVSTGVYFLHLEMNDGQCYNTRFIIF